MKVWIWPLNWYFRVRELERENAALRAMNFEMERRLHTQVLMEASLSNMYTQSLIAMAANYEVAYRGNAQRRSAEGKS